MVVLNMVDAVGRLHTVEQDIRILSIASQENQITGSRIPELQNRKFVFQAQDMSIFIQAIKTIENTHQSERRTDAHQQTAQTNPASTGNKRGYRSIDRTAQANT